MLSCFYREKTGGAQGHWFGFGSSSFQSNNYSAPARLKQIERKPDPPIFTKRFSNEQLHIVKLGNKKGKICKTVL